MPKMKTHKGTAKRFKITGGGKVMHLKPHRKMMKQSKRVHFETVDQVELSGTFWPSTKGRKAPCVILLHKLGKGSHVGVLMDESPRIGVSVGPVTAQVCQRESPDQALAGGIGACTPGQAAA